MCKRLTTVEFIERAKKIHGDKYDYSKVEYKGSDTKVTIICPEHGEFQQRAIDHSRGSGCSGCGKIDRSNSKKLTTDKFIERARKVHGDKYDYSKVNYKHSRTKIIIRCPEHGEFEQMPGSHLRGATCPKCAIIKNANANRLTVEEFIKRSKKAHKDKYNYSQVKYNDANQKVCIICPTHGKFYQRAIDHMSGIGCSKCANNKKLTTEEFIERAKEIHGDKYDYNKVDYQNNHTKIIIMCPEHGEFQQRPLQHLDGSDCPKCANIKRKQTILKKYGVPHVMQSLEVKAKLEQTILKKYGVPHAMQSPEVKAKIEQTNLRKYGMPYAKQAHMTNTQDLTKEYLEANFLNEAGEIKVQEMMQYFNIKETSCYNYIHELDIKFNYRTGNGGFNPKEPATLYYIHDPQTNLYKIGITNRSVEERFGKGFCSKRAPRISCVKPHEILTGGFHKFKFMESGIAILEQTHFENGYDALEAESEILEEFSYARTLNESWPEELGGKTEFFDRDILNLDN
jgi:hypothetical protein